MPTRNIIKTYGEGNYYHAYNRGVDKMNIFLDDADYEVMLALFKRYLSPERQRDLSRNLLPNYHDSVDLVAYCLMPNHYHLLLYLKQKQGIEKLMRSVMTAYSRYFNTKYERVGGLFQNHFLAARIGSDEYLWHVSRYIHLNPLDINQDPLTYLYSSIGYFRGDKKAGWMSPHYLVENSDERKKYIDSINDMQDYHRLQARLKHLLAEYQDNNVSR